MALRIGKEPLEFGKICRLFVGSGIDGEEDGGGGVIFGAELRRALRFALSWRLVRTAHFGEFSALQITCDSWCRIPIVVLAVNVNDRRGRKLFGCDIFQASQVNSINAIDVRCVANAE